MSRAGFFSVWLLLLAGFLAPAFSSAQEVFQEFQERVSAEVLEVVSEEQQEITGTDATRTVQTVRIRFNEGERAGEFDLMTNEVVTLEVGDNIFVDRVIDISGTEWITYADFERRPVLIAITLLFVALLVLLSRWQAVRALASLLASIAAILFILVPALLAGYDAVLVATLTAGFIMAVVLFGTHGFKPTPTIAFGGMFMAVVVTGMLAWISSSMMRLTGFSNDASVYLNFATNGQLDLAGLLLGSIIIGILGVLDDVSITQAAVVRELKIANSTLKAKQLYHKALIVGRAHIGSLVNTLALAYTSVSLPIILLYAKTENSIWQVVNQEVIAAELIRIIVGSIGLILAVPFTTAVAAWYYQDRVILEADDSEHGHGHGHHHH
jgi:uncharacterized membrane protein